MRQLDEIELRLKLLMAEERRRVRARYARQATAELNRTLPTLETNFAAEVQAGRLPEFRDVFPLDEG